MLSEAASRKPRRAMVAIMSDIRTCPAARRSTCSPTTWRRTTRVPSPQSSGASIDAGTDVASAGARPPPRSATGRTSAASTGATPSSCCRSSQLLDPLRRAFAAGGGWMPRVETAADAGRRARPADRRGWRRARRSIAADRPLDRRASCCAASAGAPSGRDATAAASTRPSAGWSPTAHELLARRWRRKPPAEPGRGVGASSSAPLPARRAPGARRSPPSRSNGPRWRRRRAPTRCSPFGPSAWIAIAGRRPRRAGRARCSREAAAPTLHARCSIRPNGALFDWPRIAALAGPRCLRRLRGRSAVRPRRRCWRTVAPAERPVALIAQDRAAGAPRARAARAQRRAGRRRDRLEAVDHARRRAA